MTDINLIQPLLNIIKTAIPDYQLRFWDSDLKIRDKIITYYTSFAMDKTYNAKAYNIDLSLDLWDLDASVLPGKVMEINNALESYNQITTIEEQAVYIIVYNIAWSDSGREKDTKLNRKHIELQITAIELPEEGITVLQDILAGGAGHSVIVKDGKLYLAGYNRYGQLGNGSTTNRESFITLTSPSNIQSVSCAANTTFVIDKDNVLWSWGDSYYGELGSGISGTNAYRNYPGQIATDVLSVRGNAEHVIAVKKDYTTWAWGNNNYGQLGDGTKTLKKYPIKVPITDKIIYAVACRSASFFITDKNEVYATGDNSYGAFGIGNTNSPFLTPYKLPINNVKRIVGSYTPLFLKKDGTVWATGYNSFGESGIGTKNVLKEPVKVLSDCIDIAQGTFYSLFLKNDGTVWSVGVNNNGELGDGTTTASLLIKQIPGLKNIVAIGTGANTCMAMDKAGNIYIWGLNSSGQCGLPSTTAKILTPTKITI